MGGQSSSTQTQQSQSAPWQPAQPMVQDILGQLNPLIQSSGLNSTESNAISQLSQNVAQGNPYAPQIGSFVSPPWSAGRRRTTWVRLVALVAWTFAVMCVPAVAFLGCSASYAGEVNRVAQESDVDWGKYRAAVSYCRGDVPRPMALSSDRQILCFDKAGNAPGDFSSAANFEKDGVVAVRGLGGDIAQTIELADLLRDKNATVVIYDYCLTACATFLQFASEKTFVLKDSVVGWGYSANWPWCPALVPAEDSGPKRVDIAPCADAPDDFRSQAAIAWQSMGKFYRSRIIGPPMEWPPQSAFVRKRLRGLMDAFGQYPEVYWMWNPRYYANAIRTRVVFEAYPRNQDEVDALAARLHIRALYDP